MEFGIRPAIAALVLAVLLPVAPLAEQQPPLTQSQIDIVKKEVTAAVDKYYRLFTERNAKALPEEVFNIPWIVVGGNGPQPDLTREQALARFEASMKQLVESGWGKSVFTTENVCVLNANAAIASGFNTRYKTDGTVMSVGGVSYWFARTKDGWRIVSYTGHARDKVVRCE
jgi:hypothetical protein